MFRTTGYNSIRTLTARFSYLQALSGDKLACLPLELRLRGKSTRQSHGTPIFYVDLTLRSGIDIDAALQQARQLDQARQEAGFDQQALDAAAQQGLINGAFEDSEDEAHQVLEEFYPEAARASPLPLIDATTNYSSRKLRRDKPTLHDLIIERAQGLQQTSPPSA